MNIDDLVDSIPGLKLSWHLDGNFIRASSNGCPMTEIFLQRTGQRISVLEWTSALGPLDVSRETAEIFIATADGDVDNENYDHELRKRLLNAANVTLSPESDRLVQDLELAAV